MPLRRANRYGRRRDSFSQVLKALEHSVTIWFGLPVAPTHLPSPSVASTGLVARLEYLVQ